MRKSHLLQEEKNNNNLLRLIFFIYVTEIGILKQRVKKIFRARLKSVAVPMEDKNVMQMSQIGILKSILW